MSAIRAVVRREITGLVNTSVGPVVGSLSLMLASGSFFWLNDFLGRNLSSLDAWFEVWPAIFAFLLPALTMRSFAEERESGMSELLAVFPVSDAAVVLGKFVALLIFVATIMVLSLPVPLGISLLGTVPFGPLLGQYLALLLLAATMSSVGLLLSAVVRSQLIAYVMTTIVLLLLSFVDAIPGLFSLGAAPATAFRAVSLNLRYERLAQGLLDIGDIVWLLAVTAIVLRFAMHVVAARRYGRA